jgi:outer membrane lipoprotein SlyB
MKSVVALSLAAVLLGACSNARDSRMAEGALIGGTGGALIGGIASGSAGGAVVGGVAGAAAGAIVADATRPQGRPYSCYTARSGREVCRYR